MAKRVDDALNILGFPYFSGSFRVMVPFFRLMSVHFRRQASPLLIAVSLRS